MSDECSRADSDRSSGSVTSPFAARPSPHLSNPAARVRDTFEHIWRTRMADVAIVNPNLRVDIVGWRAWKGEWLGVLVTPWSISLMLLPGVGGCFRSLAMGERQSWPFPSGVYDFIGGNEVGLGAYQVCSLFSPVQRFVSQDEAVATAQAAMDALLRAEPGEGLAAAQLETARVEVRPGVKRGMSRRMFLRGGR